MAGHPAPVVMTSCNAQVSHFVISQDLSGGQKSGGDRWSGVRHMSHHYLIFAITEIKYVTWEEGASLLS